jgi:hypothetical protein
MRFDRALIACLLASTAATAAADDRHWNIRDFSNRDLSGTWTITGWVEATLLSPIPAQTTPSTPPSTYVSRGDKVTIRGAIVGLFEFDGRGTITSFRDLFKAGGLEPVSPPVPFPFVPPAPETGHGEYTVNPDGTVHLATTIVDEATGFKAGEAEYDCILNRLPRQLECVFSRFKTYVVDPNGFEAPIVGQLTLRPQLR